MLLRASLAATGNGPACCVCCSSCGAAGLQTCLQVRCNSCLVCLQGHGGLCMSTPVPSCSCLHGPASISHGAHCLAPPSPVLI